MSTAQINVDPHRDSNKRRYIEMLRGQRVKLALAVQTYERRKDVALAEAGWARLDELDALIGGLA